MSKKTLIFSDTHLTHRFDRAKFNALVRAVKKVDRVIINGDFWDAYETTWEMFLHSKWSALFPLLKQKNTVYIFGNHDKKEFADQRVKVFSDTQVNVYKLKFGKNTLEFQHGYLIAPSRELKFPFFQRRWIIQLGSILESLGVWMFGAGFLKLIHWRENTLMRIYAQKNLGSVTVLVCGHSHLQEDSRKKGFVNTGVFRYGLAQYLVIEGEELGLVSERY